jgi:hypothetical protein
MTQYEILKFAFMGCADELTRKEEIAKRLKADSKPSPLTDKQIERLKAQFNEILDLMGIEEKNQ